MLVDWGTSIADEMGAPCIVECSRFAHPVKVYQHHGFQDVRKVEIRDEKRFPGVEALEYFFMYRPVPDEQ